MRTSPTTASTTPIVSRMGILATRPTSRTTTPKTIISLSHFHDSSRAAAPGRSCDGHVDAEHHQGPQQDREDGSGDMTHRAEIRQVVVLGRDRYPYHQIDDGDDPTKYADVPPRQQRPPRPGGHRGSGW